MRTRAYCIKGAPISWKTVVHKNTRFYDSYIQQRIAFNINLEKQHNNEPLFMKSVHIDTIFYMPISKSLHKRKESIYHCTPPHLPTLFHFLVRALEGIVIQHEQLVSSLTLKKVYDKVPRTEFIITEVV